MSQNHVEQLTIGIDLGDRVSHYCVIDSQGAVLEEGRMRTLQESLRQWVRAFPGARQGAERLTRYGRIDPALLGPIAHRSQQL